MSLTINSNPGSSYIPLRPYKPADSCSLRGQTADCGDTHPETGTTVPGKWRKYVKRRGDGGGFPNGGWEEIEQACRKKISALQGLWLSWTASDIPLPREAGGCRKTGKTVVLSRTMAGLGDIGIVRYLRPDCELRKGKKTKMYAHQGHKCIQRRQKQKESCIMHIKNLNIMHDAIVRIVQF